MDSHFIFLSNKFSPTAGELDEEHDDYINPGLFALELADFVEKSLRRHGYEVKSRCQEDWGHWLEIDHPGKYTLAVCCTSYEEMENGLHHQRVFVRPDMPVIRRWFKKIDVREDVEKLSSAIRSSLADDPDISNLELQES